MSRQNGDTREDSAKMRKNVHGARRIQQRRFKNDSIHSNAEMKNKQIKEYCPLAPEVKRLLLEGARKFQLSARSYYKMIKIARTIADLDFSSEIKIAHMAEALQYRTKTKAQT